MITTECARAAIARPVVGDGAIGKAQNTCIVNAASRGARSARRVIAWPAAAVACTVARDDAIGKVKGAYIVDTASGSGCDVRAEAERRSPGGTVVRHNAIGKVKGA